MRFLILAILLVSCENWEHDGIACIEGKVYDNIGSIAKPVYTEKKPVVKCRLRGE